MGTHPNSNGNPNLTYCCNEGFAELCALSTSGRLTGEERRRLDTHVSVCPDCRAVLREYESLASRGMAKIAGVALDCGSPLEQVEWNQQAAKRKLLSQLDASTEKVREEQRVSVLKHGGWRRLFSGYRTLAWAGAAVAVFIISVSFAYQRGVKRTVNHAAVSANVLFGPNKSLLTSHLDNVRDERQVLLEEVTRNEEIIQSLQKRAFDSENKIAEFEGAKANLEATIQQLKAQDAENATTVSTLSAERDALRQQLEQSETALRSVRDELKSSQDERRLVLVRSASLENQVDQLRSQLQESQDTSGRQQQYLASDRDIRELMGARQLYIADVFDVNAQGETKKPFGRVFYTRGKSLIFYAFDLDRQPGYREAKIFQAWGRPAATQSTPVSLGIFYMDNQANRRWALKFDDPKVLEEISSVFVTLEPNGGSKKPTNKPFLVAYLHTAPANHP